MKILRVLLLVVAVTAIAAVAYVAIDTFVISPSRADDFDQQLFSTSDNNLVERGRYLAVAGNCVSCHTANGGPEMAGGLEFVTPFGTIFSTNITSDPETGIGNWSGPQFAASMRHGVRPDGEHLYPVFPYTSFTKIDDADLAALFAYFKTVPPVSSEPPENDLTFPFNVRALMSLWKLLNFDSGVYKADETQTEEWNRGGYLVRALAHCDACHAPRNLLGGQSETLMSGGAYIDKVPGGARQLWSAPDLSSAPHGLSLWSEEDVASYLQTGRNSFLETFGPMNEVIMNSTRHLEASDINAMAYYLKSLPSSEPERRSAATDQQLGMGRTLYNLHCGTCHLPSGLGDPEMAPQIASGSLVVQESNPASLINVILYSPEAPHPPLPPKWREPMDEFQYLLDDEEVAALASFVRASWDNAGGAVSAEQVARQR